MRGLVSLVSLLLLVGVEIPAEPLGPGSAEQLRELSKTLRDSLAENLPTPLYEKVYNWNETEKTPSRITFDGFKPRMIYRQKNDGMWRKVRVEADNPGKHLVLDIRNVGARGDDTTTFDVFVALRARAHYHQQNWQQGLKLWDATADARVRIKLLMHCECTARFEKAGGSIPDLVYRLRVVKAEADYEDLEVTHIAGVGGELAKFLGEAARKAVRELKPSLEEKLLARAEASIVKAADTKELRVGLGGIKKSRK